MPSDESERSPPGNGVGGMDGVGVAGTAVTVDVAPTVGVAVGGCSSVAVARAVACSVGAAAGGVADAVSNPAWGVAGASAVQATRSQPSANSSSHLLLLKTFIASTQTHFTHFSWGTGGERPKSERLLSVISKSRMLARKITWRLYYRLPTITLRTHNGIITRSCATGKLCRAMAFFGGAVPASNRL